MSHKNITQRIRKTKQRVSLYLLAKKVEKLEKQLRLQQRINAHQVALNERQQMINDSMEERLPKARRGFIGWLLALLGR